jgi:hypothetical protein
MPKYIILGVIIENIINSALNKGGYKGPKKQVEYDIDWDDSYQELCLHESFIKEEVSYGEYYGVLINTNTYPLKDEKLIIRDGDLYKIVIKLIIDNSNGWNTDERARGDNPEWYDNYDDKYEIIKEDGISLNDIANGVFSVKSGKLDNNYELFMRAYCSMKEYKKRELELNITLKFDHGS